MGRAIDMENDIAQLKKQMSEMQGVLKEILDTVKVKKENTDEIKQVKKSGNSGSSPSVGRTGGSSNKKTGTTK